MAEKKKTNKEDLIESLDNIYDNFVGLPDNFDRDKQRTFIEFLYAFKISVPTFLRYSQRIELSDLEFYQPWYKI